MVRLALSFLLNFPYKLLHFVYSQSMHTRGFSYTSRVDFCGGMQIGARTFVLLTLVVVNDPLGILAVISPFIFCEI